MTEFEDPVTHVQFGNSPDIWIDQHATGYAQEVADYLDELTAGTRRPDEKPLLDSFNSHVEKVVTAFDHSKIKHRGDSLLFSDIYAAADDTTTAMDEVLQRAHIELLMALLAAEVELRGPLRLSRTQNMRLADTYEQLGHRLLSAELPGQRAKTFLPGHAAMAFLRASGLHALNEDIDAQDRCGLALARARRTAIHPAWRRSAGWASDLMCGYGYRPFRLLVWIAALLLVFTVALWLSTPISITTSLHMCLINFLNPLGLGDIEKVSRAGHVLLIIESYAGIVATSVFFALLVRRWFRL
ncbi:hypothetical protein OHB12_18230 [Nocardia sp. NBC_01730]|uniref:hypothetical protein n=1 Tax=Nocardia sp. NBC_01730 TaxID=2975998 RepID=UPI002E10A5F5|nr:hypothetical protein OHB12_18230 [Nocardia sp. NBC_01730]